MTGRSETDRERRTEFSLRKFMGRKDGTKVYGGLRAAIRNRKQEGRRTNQERSKHTLALDGGETISRRRSEGRGCGSRRESHSEGRGVTGPRAPTASRRGASVAGGRSANDHSRPRQTGRRRRRRNRRRHPRRRGAIGANARSPRTCRTAAPAGRVFRPPPQGRHEGNGWSVGIAMRLHFSGQWIELSIHLPCRMRANGCLPRKPAPLQDHFAVCSPRTMATTAASARRYRSATARTSASVTRS